VDVFANVCVGTFGSCAGRRDDCSPEFKRRGWTHDGNAAETVDAQLNSRSIRFVFSSLLLMKGYLSIIVTTCFQRAFLMGLWMASHGNDGPYLIVIMMCFGFLLLGFGVFVCGLGIMEYDFGAVGVLVCGMVR